MPHQGEILQDAIKQSGVSISRLVQDLGITRPTIYRKFREETLDEAFVKRVGELIGRIVTFDGTDVTATVLLSLPPSVTAAPFVLTSPVTDPAKALIVLQEKYVRLLEDYNALLLKVYTPR